MPDDPYSLGDLARLADVTPRTVRYYVAQGLLPSPEAAGPATRYGEGHLARLRLIRRLQRDHLPLAEIRARLERMGDEEVVAAAAVLDPQEPEPVAGGGGHAGLRPVADAPGGRAPDRRGAAAVAAHAAGTSPRPAGHAAGAQRRPLGPPAVRQLARASPAAWLDSSPTPGRGRVARTGPTRRRPRTRHRPSPGRARRPSRPRRPAPGPRTQPDRSTWERLVISPDVELHVRRPLDRPTNKRVDQLERIARELFEDT